MAKTKNWLTEADNITWPRVTTKLIISVKNSHPYHGKKWASLAAKSALRLSVTGTKEFDKWSERDREILLNDNCLKITTCITRRDWTPLAAELALKLLKLLKLTVTANAKRIYSMKQTEANGSHHLYTKEGLGAIGSRTIVKTWEKRKITCLARGKWTPLAAELALKGVKLNRYDEDKRIKSNDVTWPRVPN